MYVESALMQFEKVTGRRMWWQCPPFVLDERATRATRFRLGCRCRTVAARSH